MESLNFTGRNVWSIEYLSTMSQWVSHLNEHQGPFSSLSSVNREKAKEGKEQGRGMEILTKFLLAKVE